MDLLKDLEERCSRAKEASKKLALLGTKKKNEGLRAMADALESDIALASNSSILQANAEDVAAARDANLAEALVDRLALSERRVLAMAKGLRQVAELKDPVGEEMAGWRLPNGLEVRKVRVPLGVVGIIYESRPNVTTDAAGLCLKSGNSCVLRGGSDALRSNKAVAAVIASGLLKAGFPEGCVELIPSADREVVKAFCRMNGYLDVIIPRGGAGLIKMTVENATVPVIETGTGVCHTFVDASADLAMAEEICFNAKVSRPGVCNAMETLLVHRDAAGTFLPKMIARYRTANVEIRGCEETAKYHQDVKAASEEDWATEYLDLILSIRVVKGIDEAIAHISKYGTRHSEAIVTRDLANARRFQGEVDAAAVYVNASTRFTDGEEFGFGAEIGISTQKLHARGPMGLAELTSIKYLVSGEGQIRT